MTVIRPAQITELNRLLEIVSAATHHMESQGIHQWDNIYPDGTTLKADIEKQHMQVVEVNGQIAGMISINDEQSPEYGNVQWRYAGKALVVHRLTIDPTQQRRGLATRLMQFAEEIAESKGYDTIRFDAFTQNHGATALYENLGYEKAGTVQFRKGLFFCFEKPVNPLGKKWKPEPQPVPIAASAAQAEAGRWGKKIMSRRGIALAVVLVAVGARAWAGDLYFGGHGDTNVHWTGYSVQLATDGLTNWVAYTLARPGQIARAPATFHRTDTNRWSAVFDEYVFRTNGALIGLAGHHLVVLRIDSNGLIAIQDGADKLELKKISAGELKRIERGRPNNTPEDIRR